MKKLYLASALATVLTLSSNAMAIDSTGCGLGSMAWRGQSGTAPQILAVTTNGSFGTQTFGISSGTSGCDQNGRITRRNAENGSELFGKQYGAVCA